MSRVAMLLLPDRISAVDATPWCESRWDCLVCDAESGLNRKLSSCEETQQFIMSAYAYMQEHGCRVRCFGYSVDAADADRRQYELWQEPSTPLTQPDPACCLTLSRAVPLLPLNPYCAVPLLPSVYIISTVQPVPCHRPVVETVWWIQSATPLQAWTKH